MKSLIILSVIAVFWGGCSFKPEDPGLCRLTCQNSIIASASSEFEIKLATGSPKIYCDAAGADLAIPVMLQFVISEKNNVSADKVEKRPVPNISFDPLVAGAVAPDVYNNENVTKDAEGKLTPAHYLGITTPKSNWCSDSCGVMTLEIVPVCPQPSITSEISVQLHSGALYSDPAQISIQNTVTNQ